MMMFDSNRVAEAVWVAGMVTKILGELIAVSLLAMFSGPVMKPLL